MTATLETSTDKKLVDYWTDGGVAVIQLNDPPANTYTYEMNRQLDDAILQARFDDSVYVIVLRGAGHKFFGPTNAVDVWAVKKVNPQSMVHLTEKPVELAARAMQYSSRPGENVLDLFGGSGSTLIGAEQAGRKAFLMELDTPYCDVIVTRWENFTGNKAERIPRGERVAV